LPGHESSGTEHDSESARGEYLAIAADYSTEHSLFSGALFFLARFLPGAFSSWRIRA
jgi:hypothetical protein